MESFNSFEDKALKYGIFDAFLSFNSFDTEILKEYHNDIEVELYDVINLTTFSVIRYWTKRANKNRVNHTIIIDSEFNILKEDHFDEYPCLSGPIDEAYYYIEGGELFVLAGGAIEGKIITSGLMADEMWPLGVIKRFLIKKNDGAYTIVDTSGNTHGSPFSIDSNFSMDAICNARYLPIVDGDNYGRISIDGISVVPAEYQEVVDM